MAEKMKLYNEHGQVNDSEVAEEMAYTEKYYKEKRPFTTHDANIKYGNEAVEAAGQKYAEKKFNMQKLLEKMKLFEFTRRGVKLDVGGHILEIAGDVKVVGHQKINRKFEFIASSGTINGGELSKDDLEKIMRRLKDIILEKYLKNENELKKSETRQRTEDQRQKNLSTMNKPAINDILD